MEDQIFLGIFVLRRQHRTRNSLSRKVYPWVPLEWLQVLSCRLLNGLHTRGRNKVILSYTDWSKEWKAMGIFSADLRADFEERRYLQLHKYLPIFTLSLTEWEFGKSRTLPKLLPFFFFLASLLRSSATTHCCGRDINPCSMLLKCYQNISRYCVLAWTKLSSFRAACFRDLSTMQAHYLFLCKYIALSV